MSKRTIIFHIDHLGCANCANKMEEAIGGVDGVYRSTVDFARKRLILELDEGKEEQIKDKSQELVSSIEEGAVLIPLDERVPAGEETEGKSERLRLGIAIALFFIGTFAPLHGVVKLAVLIGAYLISGWEVLLTAFRNIGKGLIFDENFLMTVASLGAFAIGEAPEGVAVMVFYAVGEYFQDLAVDRSRKSIAEAMDIRPEFARVYREGGFQKVHPNQVRVGERIQIGPGERVALDGQLVKGRSTLNTSALTGESLPRDVTLGAEVLSGSINLTGLIEVEVTSVYAESTVAKILDLVENATSKKAATERFITRFSKVYTPVVVVSALALAVLPPLVTGQPFDQWIYRALVFLVASCPCALVVSVPLTYFAGMGITSRHGILVKGSDYLDRLTQVRTVAFDKTGTITEGVFEVVEVVTVSGITEGQIVKVAADLEQHSNHPIAKSILRYSEHTPLDPVDDFTEIAGKGVRGLWRGSTVLVGTQSLLTENEVGVIPNLRSGTVVHVSVDGKYWGHIRIADRVKGEAKNAIAQLRKEGVERIVLLTGDNAETGKAIGLQVGIEEIYSNLLPQDKVGKIEDIMESHSPLLFVGDGINDAPVIARADIGVSMGDIGSDAAIEASDVVIMKDDLSKLGTLLHLAKRTKAIAYQNIVFALVFKGVVLMLGAFGQVNLWLAVFADVGVAVLAVMNGVRLLNEKEA